MKPRILYKPDRCHSLIGEIDSTIMYSLQEKFTREITKHRKLNTHKQEYGLYINSDGGHLDMAFGFYDWVKTQGISLVTIAQGFVGSAGLIVFLAAEKRISLPNTRFYLHPVSIPISSTDLTPETVKFYSQYIEDYTNRYVDLIAQHTGLKNLSIRKFMKDNHYFDASEAERMGFVQYTHHLPKVINSSKQNKTGGTLRQFPKSA